MKKMFTLLSGLLLMVAVFAADRRPVVTLNSMSNFKIVIDGRVYFSNRSQINISNLQRGYHSVQVFEMRRGYYQQRERLISTGSFFLRRNDVRIFISPSGDLRIRELKDFNRFERNDDWSDRDDDRGRERDRDRNRRDDDHRQF